MNFSIKHNQLLEIEKLGPNVTQNQKKKAFLPFLAPNMPRIGLPLKMNDRLKLAVVFELNVIAFIIVTRMQLSRLRMILLIT